MRLKTGMQLYAEHLTEEAIRAETVAVDAADAQAVLEATGRGVSVAERQVCTDRPDGIGRSLLAVRLGGKPVDLATVYNGALSPGALRDIVEAVIPRPADLGPAVAPDAA